MVLLGGSKNSRDVQDLIESMCGEKQPCQGINLDHAVAICSAAYDYVASGNTENMTLTEFKLLDIILRSLGVIVKSEDWHHFLKKGMNIQAEMTKKLWPAYEDQDSCHFSIREGEVTTLGLANTKIGNFTLKKSIFTEAAIWPASSTMIVTTCFQWHHRVTSRRKKGDDCLRGQEIPLHIAGLT